MKQINKNIYILNNDSISKYNFFEEKKYLSLNCFKIIVFLKTIDSGFLNNFLNLTKIFFF